MGSPSPKQTANSVKTLHLGRATSSVRERAFPSPILSFLDILPVVKPAGRSASAFPSSWADACTAPASRLSGGMRSSDATEPPDGILRSASDSCGEAASESSRAGECRSAPLREVNEQITRTARFYQERELGLSFGDWLHKSKAAERFPLCRFFHPAIRPVASADAGPVSARRGRTSSGAGLHARLIRARLRARCL